MDDDIRIFFARSKLRLKVLQELEKSPQIASFLGKKIDKHREVISRIFHDLKEKGLVICTNEKDPHFRYYKITKKGKKVVKELNDLEH